MNDGSSFHDFPSDSDDSNNFRSIDDPDDQDIIPSNFGMDSSEEEEQPHIKDKGKGPGTRPSSEVFQAMVYFHEAPSPPPFFFPTEELT